MNKGHSRCKKRLLVSSVFSTFLLTGSWSANAGEITISPAAANLWVQQELLVQTLGEVGQLVGAEPSRQIAWFGDVNSNGWSLSVNSPYRDGNLSLSYSGVYDSSSDTGTWQGGGSYSVGGGEVPSSSLSWNDTGSATGVTHDWGWSKLKHWVVKKAAQIAQITWDAVVVGVQGVVVYEACTNPPGAVVCNPTGFAEIAGVSAVAIGGPIVVRQIDTFSSTSLSLTSAEVLAEAKSSSAAPPFQPPFPVDAPGLMIIPNPDYPAVDVVSGGVANTAGADLFSLYGTARISTPEPGSLILLGSGLVAIFCCAWWRPRYAA